MKRKLMAARKSNNPTLWDNLRISNKTYNKLHTKTKRNEWRKFCADTESAEESARMSNILKNCNDKKEKLESVYKPDGTLTETPDETLEIMEKSHFKDGDPPAHTNTNTTPDKHLSQIIYSESRMQEAISSFDPLKAAGPDTLQPLTIRKAWHHIHKPVRNIMIKSHEMQHVPGSWTESNGIFLPKQITINLTPTAQ